MKNRRCYGVYEGRFDSAFLKFKGWPLSKQLLKIFYVLSGFIFCLIGSGHFNCQTFTKGFKGNIELYDVQ